MVKAGGVDAVTKSSGQMPLARNPGFLETVARQEKRVGRDDIVLAAMDEKHGRRFRARRPIGGEMFGPDQNPGKADDGGGWAFATQASVEGHHGPLAEADKGQFAVVEPVARQFGVEKSVERGMRLVDAEPALGGIAHRQRKPLAAHRGLPAGLRGMRGHEGRVRQDRLPLLAERDQILAIGAVAMEEDHELFRIGLGPKARTVDQTCHAYLHFRRPADSSPDTRALCGLVELPKRPDIARSGDADKPGLGPVLRGRRDLAQRAARALGQGGLRSFGQGAQPFERESARMAPNRDRLEERVDLDRLFGPDHFVGVAGREEIERFQPLRGAFFEQQRREGVSRRARREPQIECAEERAIGGPVDKPDFDGRRLLPDEQGVYQQVAARRDAIEKRIRRDMGQSGAVKPFLPQPKSFLRECDSHGLDPRRRVFDDVEGNLSQTRQLLGPA